MPFGMVDYVQSVVVQGRLYVGGGFDDLGSDNNYTVMEYDISSGAWTTLPPYRACYFAMTVIKNQLVLVGGKERDAGESKVLGVWGAGRKAWTHPYPDMPTARQGSSALVHHQWLVVAGGWAPGECVSCVEVLNTESKQWYAGPPTPTPWTNMKTAVVGDVGYCMGGYVTGSATSQVYGVCMSTLISHITSTASSGPDREIWKEIPGLQLTHSTPLSIRGALLAVSGMDKGKAVTGIHLYHPDTGEWVKVGDLPSPCRDCTCAMIGDREMLVAAGTAGGWVQRLKSVHLALIG